MCATLLGVALLQPLGAKARSDALQEAIAGFEQRGFVIRREHPRCAEPQLFGLYVRGRREVVVCPRGNQLGTLLHESWHAVQSLCLREKPLLGLDALLPRLRRRDRLELQVLYRPERWQREAEARVMAREPLDRYLQTLDRSCTAAVPEAPKAN
ncbi:hypothetical protein [Cyanobium sp. To12R1]|uniref:hypothetical protein n=1 Tax=Cyanobium sp. To12R1 TaxID=2823723 RepID=UPI0020CC9D2B|nr:hypothetical protein [Cyanobium sp. To12R1]